MAQSLAEKYRAHREVMEAALRWKVTPKAAEKLLRAEKARREREEGAARLAARMNAPIVPGLLLADSERSEPWYRQGSMA